MPLVKLASSHAHAILSKMIDLGLIPAERATAVARDEMHGVQVVVMITPYQGPMRISEETLKQIAAIADSQEPPRCPIEASPTPGLPAVPSSPADVDASLADLREVERNALEAAPGPTDPPVTVKRLATLAGYAYGSYFREAVRELVDARLLVRVTGGVRRAAAPTKCP